MDQGGLRILVLASDPPFPPLGGTPMRTYQLLRHLSRRHTVTLLAYGTQLSAGGGVPQRLAVRLVPWRRPQGIRKRIIQLAALCSPDSYQHRSLYSLPMQRAITAELAAHPYDVVLVERSQMGGFDLGRRALRVLDEHNLEYEALYRSFRIERSPLRKLYNLLEYAKFRRAERWAWARFDGCVITSERERTVIDAVLPGKPTGVVPNGVDLEYFRFHDGAADPAAILFTGSMDYRPNIDAALHFAHEILPEILRARPDAVFTIVGMRPPPAIVSLHGAHVVVTGEVSDVRPYLERAAVVVVPLRMGSGTRLKLLEAMATGKPVVTTRLGCEGLAVRDGEDLVIADEPRAFAHAVLRVLGRPALARELGRRGRAVAEREYGWEPAAGRLETFLAGLVALRQDVGPRLVHHSPTVDPGLV